MTEDRKHPMCETVTGGQLLTISSSSKVGSLAVALRSVSTANSGSLRFGLERHRARP
jgi:hypothetical protein